MVKSRKITEKGVPAGIVVNKYAKSGLFRVVRGHKAYYELYHRGRRIESHMVSRTGLSLENAKKRYHDDMTLREGYTRSIEPLARTTEYTYLKKADIDMSGSLKGKASHIPQIKKVTTRGGEDVKLYQYVVQCIKNGKIVAARSQMSGREFAKTPDQMRQEAWDNFYMVLDAWDQGRFGADSKGGDIVQGRFKWLDLSDNERDSTKEGFVSYMD